MTTIDVATSGWLKPADVVTLAIYFASLYIAAKIASTIYVAFFGPLSKFPGPTSRALSVLPKVGTIIRGQEHTEIAELHRKYGPIVRTGPNELSFAGGAQAWKDIYGFKKPGQAGNIKDRVFYTKAPNGIDGLITSDDANHSRQRKTVSNAFSDKALRELEPMLKKWAEKMKFKLGEFAANGSESDLLKFYNCTTFDIMGDLSFAEGLNMLDEGEYSPWVKNIFGGIKKASQLRVFAYLGPFTRWIVNDLLASSPTVRRLQMEHWSYVTTRVDRRLERSPDHPDLWTKILEKSHGPDALSVGEHHAIGSLFMIAGTETTATALSGTTYHLLRNPSILARLVAEIRSEYSDYDSITLDSLAKLPFLHAVLREGLRMYPPVPTALPRITPKGGTMLCDTFVPEDVTIGVHHYASYRSSANFKNPDCFAPTRWLGDPEYAGDNLDAVEPFSVGPRNCLGKNLAWHEMRLLLATVMLHFDLKLAPQCENWQAGQKVYTLWEKVPLIVTLKQIVA